MKLIIIKANLQVALSAVERIAGENKNLPILKNVAIRAEKNTIRITTTNLELAISYDVPGKIIESGSTTAPVGVLASLINGITNERIEVEHKDAALQIKTENYEASLQTLPDDDFPIIPKLKGGVSWMINGGALKGALDQVVGSAQASELRPELGAVLFSFLVDKIKIVATDSFRLAEKTIPQSAFSISSQEPFDILVPLRTIHELIRIIKPDEEIRVAHDETQVSMASDRFELISRRVQGKFPDYEQIIPPAFEAEAIVNREECMSALKLVSVLSARVSEVRLRSKSPKSLEVGAGDQHIGTNNYILPAKASGEFRETAFNWRYLYEGLRAAGTESVSIGIAGENKPARIKSSTDASYLYILSPILRV
jgi:DNA polymerase-3 subunit beta